MGVSCFTQPSICKASKKVSVMQYKLGCAALCFGLALCSKPASSSVS